MARRIRCCSCCSFQAEAMSMDFVVRPQSKVDPDEIRARAKQVVQDQRRMKVQVHELGFSEMSKVYVFRGSKDLSKDQVG
ncbi:hypothetical protein CASFOL_014329 [Castilleja foliolosa]|uniref:Uncharacterized protein n=2 Tax=Castilleja foliolosa TaxID=1961234 RepID=A0ABD3DNP9_9LAMI